ncbi:MAG: insulinase family protein [Oscillospiraceae bacterium]|nr:insulinase family protein [Oscillospiraceae bacterium]
MKLNEYKEINERLYTAKLPNGLPVFVVPKPGFHKKYAFFATDYGGVDRRFQLAGKWTDTPAGVAHFLEHKLFDTEDGNALERLSANGASPNAYTASDITAYYFECIDDFSENLEILLDFVSVPYFTKESVEKEQGIIDQEIRMVEDDPDFNLYYGLLKSLFKENPVRDSVAGTVESIKKITANTLYDCHKVFYAPSNMALCVVGDVDPSMVYDIAEKILPTEKSEIPLRDYGTKEGLSPVTANISKEMEVSLPIFLAGCKLTPGAHGQDVLRLEVISAIALELLCGHSSPFYHRLYAEGLINADFSASFDSTAGVAYTMFGGETRDPGRVFAELKKELSNLLSHGPDTALFERIKKAAIGSHIRALNSFGVLAASISEGHFKGFDPFTAPVILSKLTVDDISEFISKNLVSDNMAISIINPIK